MLLWQCLSTSSTLYKIIDAHFTFLFVLTIAFRERPSSWCLTWYWRQAFWHFFACISFSFCLYTLFPVPSLPFHLLNILVNVHMCAHIPYTLQSATSDDFLWKSQFVFRTFFPLHFIVPGMLIHYFLSDPPMSILNIFCF